MNNEQIWTTAIMAEIDNIKASEPSIQGAIELSALYNVKDKMHLDSKRAALTAQTDIINEIIYNLSEDLQTYSDDTKEFIQNKSAEYKDKVLLYDLKETLIDIEQILKLLWQGASCHEEHDIIKSCLQDWQNKFK